MVYYILYITEMKLDTSKNYNNQENITIAVSKNLSRNDILTIGTTGFQRQHFVNANMKCFTFCSFNNIKPSGLNQSGGNENYGGQSKKSRYEVPLRKWLWSVPCMSSMVSAWVIKESSRRKHRAEALKFSKIQPNSRILYEKMDKNASVFYSEESYHCTSAFLSKRHLTDLDTRLLLVITSELTRSRILGLGDVVCRKIQIGTKTYTYALCDKLSQNCKKKRLLIRIFEQLMSNFVAICKTGDCSIFGIIVHDRRTLATSERCDFSLQRTTKWKGNREYEEG